MTTLTRQELCAHLRTSESTVRRMEQDGMPFVPVGRRGKRYDLAEVKAWLQRSRPCPSGSTKKDAETSVFRLTGSAYIASCQGVRVRVTPSKPRPDYDQN